MEALLLRTNMPGNVTRSNEAVKPSVFATRDAGHPPGDTERSTWPLRSYA